LQDTTGDLRYKTMSGKPQSPRKTHTRKRHTLTLTTPQTNSPTSPLHRPGPTAPSTLCRPADWAQGIRRMFRRRIWRLESAPLVLVVVTFRLLTTRTLSRSAPLEMVLLVLPLLCLSAHELLRFMVLVLVLLVLVVLVSPLSLPPISFLSKTHGKAATARRDNDPPHVLITQYQVVQPPTPARTVEEAPRQLPSSTAAVVPAPEAVWSLANPVPLGPRHPRHVSAQDLAARERAAANDGVDIAGKSMIYFDYTTSQTHGKAAVPVPAPTVQEAGWSLATAVPLGPRHPRHVSAQDLAARESASPSVGAGVAEPNNLPTRPDAGYSLARTPASLAMLGPHHGTHVSAYDLAIRERAADVPAPTVGEGGFSLARTPASLGPRHGTHVSAYAQDLAVRERTLATAARTGGSGTGASIGSGRKLLSPLPFRLGRH
jgi:hypothetical protein